VHVQVEETPKVKWIKKVRSVGRLRSSGKPVVGGP